jgi:hypothetical protein
MSDDKIERTRFEIKYHHRHELREWIKQNFPFVSRKGKWDLSQQEHKTLQERADEILDACRQVEERDLNANSSYIDYYKEDWQRIKQAHRDKDYTAMSEALQMLLDGIDFE